MNSESTRIIALDSIANRVQSTSPQISKKIREVAAQMQSQMEAVPYAAETDSEIPPATVEFNESGAAPKVEIEKFVASKEPKRTHNATVTFIAPMEMSESDIMDYIIGIRKLGVDVEGFKWSVADAKSKSD